MTNARPTLTDIDAVDYREALDARAAGEHDRRKALAAIDTDDLTPFHTFASVGYDVTVSWDGGGDYTAHIGTRVIYNGPSQAEAIAAAANRVLRDIAAETGEPVEAITTIGAHT